MSNTTGVARTPTARLPRLKHLVFAVIAAMTAYVLYHNERFLLDAAHPIWDHYEPFKWWLLLHGLAGACALILAPMQFVEGLRRRHTALHRTIGTIYVVSSFILAPLGLYIQYLDEDQGAARSFTIETMIQSSTLMITTGIGCYYALKREFTYHRQWMIRSYAVALTFLEIRAIVGVFGLDQPFDWHILETVVWSCVASSVLIGDIANQLYRGSLRGARPRAERVATHSPRASLSPANRLRVRAGSFIRQGALWCQGALGTVIPAKARSQRWSPPLLSRGQAFRGDDGRIRTSAP